MNPERLFCWTIKCSSQAQDTLISDQDQSVRADVVSALRLNWNKDPLVILSTGLGLGWVPIAPGTAAALVAGIVWWFLPINAWPIHALACVVSLILARWLLHALILKYGYEDAKPIVIDEIVGMGFALIWVPKIWWLYVVAFIIFRLFDIAKPWPIRWMDESLSGPYGILLDDVAAGLIACGLTYCVYHYFY